MNTFFFRVQVVFSRQLFSWSMVAVAVALFCFLPLFAHAQNVSTFPDDKGPAGLVPCGDFGEAPCDVCQIENLTRDALKLVIYAAIFLATLMIAYAGFKMVTAQGDPGAITAAKDILLKVVIGLVLVLGAWLIVDTLMRVFFRKDLGAWNTFGRCEAQPGPSIMGSTGAGTGGVSVGDPAVTGCTTCTKIVSSLPIKQGACSGECILDSDLQNRLNQLNTGLEASGVNWRITEAYPPTRTHQNACHSNGTCVDAGFTTGSVSSPSSINTFVQQASNANLRAVYEVSSDSRKQDLVTQGVPAGSIQVVGAISGEHFSVYKK